MSVLNIVKLNNLWVLAIVALLSACATPSVTSPTTAKAENPPQVADSKAITEISSSDHNAAVSMLYEWWGLFESPAGVNVLDRFDSIFTDDVSLKIGEMEIDGLDALTKVFSSLPARDLSHHQPIFTVTAQDDNNLLLEADFEYQEKPQGEATKTGKTHYAHTLTKQSDGSIKFSKLTGHVIEPLDDREFVSSFIDNRIRATVVKYIGITDDLNSGYDQLNTIMTDNTEVIGMFDPTKESFNDRGDGVLLGQNEISNWLANRKQTFSAVSHRLESLDVTELEEGRYEAAVNIATRAWPISGDPISALVPAKITLFDAGDRYMTIEKIAR